MPRYLFEWEARGTLGISKMTTTTTDSRSFQLHSLQQDTFRGFTISTVGAVIFREIAMIFSFDPTAAVFRFEEVISDSLNSPFLFPLKQEQQQAPIVIGGLTLQAEEYDKNDSGVVHGKTNGFDVRMNSSQTEGVFPSQQTTVHSTKIRTVDLQVPVVKYYM